MIFHNQRIIRIESSLKTIINFIDKSNINKRPGPRGARAKPGPRGQGQGARAKPGPSGKQSGAEKKA